eukprot:scaffold4.g4571.t1
MGREAAKLLERVRALRQEQNAAARTARATQAEQPVLPALQAALGPGTGGAASGAAQRSARATSDLHSLASVGGGEADSRVDAWRRAGKGMGPRLLELHRAQADRGVQEYYSREHAARLKAHPPYTGPSEKVLCIDVHQQPCSLPECVSCHFCRQRSTAPKTRCSRCHGVKRNGYGGAWRGVWCGSCLWARMGENIDLLNMDRWLCPCCRDICNCSGNNCQRVGRGLEVTNQLVSEAGHMGYTSVAHYLILTCISDSVVAPELGAPGAGLLAQRRRGDGREPAAKRARVNPREALVVAAAAAAQAQVDAISAELASFAASAAHGLSLSLSGLGVRPQPAESLAGGANAFLRGLGFGRGILEQDMEQGEEEAEAEEEAVTRRAAGAALDAAEGDGEQHAAAAGNDISLGEEPAGQAMAVTGETVGLAVARVLAAEAGAARSAGSQRMARGAAAQRVALEEDAQHWQENLEVVEWAEVDLYRHDPEDESFNPVTAASMDPELCYQQAYAACMSLLGDIRCQMEEQFECECAVAGAAPPPVSLLCTLARLLPEEEEPFVDFARCDATARSTLLGGLFHMLNTLASRGLPTAEVCSTIADALTKVADDAWQATQLWYQLVQEDGELPGDDITIGPWTYDADARRRPRGELGGVLYAFAEASYMLLDHELSNLQLMCQQLRHDAVPLITPALLRALLAPEQTLLVQRAGLGLVYAAVHFADGPASMEESPAESSRRRALREQLALTIKEAALPLLEDMLMQAYPLWRPRSEVLPSAGGDEHNGSEADFESRLFSPFGLEGFWRCPNPPHRTFVTYLLAETIGAAVMHSPWALRLSEPTATALLRHWLHGLLDTGGRKALAHLTRSLRSCAELQPLFSQLEEGQLEIGRDQSGEWRAHVVELVGTALAGPLYCGRLPRLVLTKRQEEVKKEAAERTLEAVLCWQSGTYRVLAALLGTLASSEQLRPRLRPLAVSLALMAVSSTEAIFQKEAQRTRAQPQHSLPASEAAGAQRAREWDVPTARHFLRTTTPFCADNLRSLWGVLVSWGAPACFEAREAANATDILRPLWSVFETCMRLCSGGVKPSPADTAVLEQLAASLAPQGASQAQAGGQLAQLRTYVLEVLVARCLVDSIVRPLHQQLRRAVSALRLTAALLTEPGMRAGHGSLADSPAALALRGLLGHFLRLLDPRVGPPSLGPREALYRLLQLLLKHDPQLLPAMQQASPAEPLGGVCEQVQAALRVFWEAAFRDVLLAVQQPVHETLNQTDIDLCHAKALQQWGQQQLMPQDGRGWGAAAEALFRQDRDSAAVDACARSWGTSLPIPAAAAPLAVAPGAPAPQPPFRPGDFKWSLAEAGLKLLQAALAAGSAAAAAADPSSPALAHTAGSGGGGSLQVAAAWVNACMPSLDEAVRICGAKLGKGAVVKSLRAAYLQLYNHLLAALGPGRMAVTLKRVAKNPAREEAAAGGEHAAPQQQQQAHGEQRQQAAWQAQGAQRQQPARQEQWQPNARGAGEQQLAAAVKDEPASQAIGPQQQAPAPTTAPQQQRRQQPAPAAGQQKQQGAPLPRAAQQAPVDVSSFDRLSGLPRGCIVNLAGRASHEALREGPRTLQLKLRDARGGRAMVAVTSQSSDRLRQRWKQELEQQLDRSRGDTWRSLRVIHLQLMAINNQQFAMITQDTMLIAMEALKSGVAATQGMLDALVLELVPPTQQPDRPGEASAGLPSGAAAAASGETEGGAGPAPERAVLTASRPPTHATSGVDDAGQGGMQPQQQQELQQREQVEGGAEAQEAASRSTVARALIAAAEGNAPLQSHLWDIPTSLFLNAEPSLLPPAGGAVLTMPSGTTPGELAALLAQLQKRQSDGACLLLHHLDASGIRLLPEAQDALLRGAGVAGGLRHWATLQSLRLSNCDIGSDFLESLLLTGSAQLRKSLRWLDLSWNSRLGEENGLPLPFWRASLLWGQAPLEHLDLSHTGERSPSSPEQSSLTNAHYASLLAALADTAREAYLPSCETVDSLQSLALGPPADGGLFDSLVVGQLARVVGCCARLAQLRVHGLSAQDADALAAFWQEAQAQRERQGHRVEDADGLLLSLSPEGEPPAVALPPSDHVLPSPATPGAGSPAAPGGEGLAPSPGADLLDAAVHLLRPPQLQQAQLSLRVKPASRVPRQPVRRGHGGRGGGHGGGGRSESSGSGRALPHAGQQQTLHAFVQRRTPVEDQAGASAGPRLHRVHSAPGSGPVRRRAGGGGRGSRGGGECGGARSPRVYWGGRAEDLGARDFGVALGSEDQHSMGERSRGQRRASARAANCGELAGDACSGGAAAFALPVGLWPVYDICRATTHALFSSICPDEEESLDYHELELMEQEGTPEEEEEPEEEARAQPPGGPAPASAGLTRQRDRGQREASAPARGGASHPARPTFTLGAHQEHEDDKVARYYARYVKKTIKRVEAPEGSFLDEAERQRAERGRRVWYRAALNAFDPKRWRNPSRDQNDTPELLQACYDWWMPLTKLGLWGERGPIWERDFDSHVRQKVEARRARELPAAAPAAAPNAQQPAAAAVGRLSSGAGSGPERSPERSSPGRTHRTQRPQHARVARRVLVESQEEEELEAPGHDRGQQPAGETVAEQGQAERGARRPQLGRRRPARGLVDDGGRGRGSDMDEGSASDDSFINDAPSSSDSDAEDGSGGGAGCGGGSSQLHASQRRPHPPQSSSGDGSGSDSDDQRPLAAWVGARPTSCSGEGRRHKCPRQGGGGGAPAAFPSAINLLSESEPQELVEPPAASPHPALQQQQQQQLGQAEGQQAGVQWAAAVPGGPPSMPSPSAALVQAAAEVEVAAVVATAAGKLQGAAPVVLLQVPPAPAGPAAASEQPGATSAAGYGQQERERQAAEKRARQFEKEQRLLAPWAWDKHADEHPPNSKHYGPPEGKRPRREGASYREESQEEMQLSQPLAEQGQEAAAEARPDGEQLPADVGGVASWSESSSDSEDVRLLAERAATLAATLGALPSATPGDGATPAPAAAVPGLEAEDAAQPVAEGCAGSGDVTAEQQPEATAAEQEQAMEEATAGSKPGAASTESDIIPDSEEE